MDEINLRSEAREEKRFLRRGIATADHADGHVAIKAPSQVAQLVRPWPINFSSFSSPVARRRTTRDNQRFCFEPLVIRANTNVLAAHFEIGHFRIRKARAEFFRLRVHVHDQLRTVDAFRKAGKVFHHGRGGELAAGMASLEDERTQVGARGVNRRGQPRATAPDDDHFLHREKLARRSKPRQCERVPELAEVEFYRKQWDAGLGAKVLAVQLHARKRIFRGTDTRALVRQLTGAQLIESIARGKQMLFRFSGDNVLGLHLGMSGTMRMEGVNFRAQKHDHLVLQQKDCALVFRDPRQFGRVRFHHGKTHASWWSTTPEITSAGFNQKYVTNFLQRHARASIKGVLLMQSGFPGIGNWMADEILWRAKILPSKLAGKLTPNEGSAVRRETRFVSREALRIVGHDNSDLPDSWLIHERWNANGICPIHGIQLKRATIGSRTTAWCPRCQK